MAHPSPLVIGAIAKQLLEELDAYERVLGEVTARPFSFRWMQAWSDQADRVYRCAQSLPHVGVSFTEFLISRAELTHAVCVSRNRITGDPAVARCADEHHSAMLSLRRACQRLQASEAAAERSGEGAASAARVLVSRSRAQ